MNSIQEQVRIRPARAAELPKLAELVRGRIPDLMKPKNTTQRDKIHKRLAGLLPDEALLLAIDKRKLSGMAALDLDHSRLLAMYLDPKRAHADTTRALITRVEETARSFGIQRLYCTVRPQAWGFMERMGYEASGLPDENEPVDLSKDLLDEASDWQRQIVSIHRELGIPSNYGVMHRLQTIREAEELVSIGPDIFNRDTELTAEAAEAWKAMQTTARYHDVDLQVVSGFRGLDYQAGLIRKKISSTRSMARILRTSAAPGYSEHHSGNALDLTTTGVTPLWQEFAMTRAYEWLKTQARLYGFRESYPKHNRHGIEWEPWHWCYRPTFDPRKR